MQPDDAQSYYLSYGTSYNPAIEYLIVAPSDDTPRLDGVEGELRAKLGAEANIERSQTYYVDVTHPLANKGAALSAIAKLLGVPLGLRHSFLKAGCRQIRG